jgi:uncharacterized protein YecE (DUF72 family)
MGHVHVGTCSWTEKTMAALWYPPGVSTPEQRLRYYAGQFDTVEVDSPFYALPQRSYAEAWARRTPQDFVFHVKAYGMMTGHEVDERALPPELRDFPHAVTPRGRVQHPSRDMVDASFDIFMDAIEPLAQAGKLGGILMQFPPFFTALTADHERRNLEYIEYAAAKLAPARMLVEFRHPSWVDEAHRERTLRFLADRGLSYVSVDSPQFPDRSTMPPLAAVTSDWSYVRFHGRNQDTWFKRTESSTERFDWDYSTAELRDWEPQLRDLAAEADETFVMFNNNASDYAQRNARQMAEILGDLVPPREEGPADGEESGGTPRLF